MLPLLALLAACTPAADDTQKVQGPEDIDGDGLTGDDDCDEGNPTVHLYADELCDGLDNDCDGTVDNGLLATWYQDRDEDGFGDESSTIEACEPPADYIGGAGDCDDHRNDIHPGALEEDCTDATDYNCDGSVGYDDADGDGYAACQDCDDASAFIHPGAEEFCDDEDDDCDGRIDVGATDAVTWYGDADEDGHGGALTIVACEAPAGFLSTSDDCNDGDATAYPGAEEVCDGADDDCDGLTDEYAVDSALVYDDFDGDGWGDPSSERYGCTGAVSVGEDCDDTDATVNPDGYETCDGADEDCDGSVDEDAVDASTWYVDGDGDAVGDTAIIACDLPAGASATDGDCDDTDDTVYPGAVEACDGVDQDCDGSVDEGVGATWYLDADGDGFGDASRLWADCSAPAGYVADDTDCDDLDDAVNPSADEYCDSVDNDCDGAVDESDAIDATRWYADADSDGWGSATSHTDACTAPAGYLATAGDCNDATAAVSPDELETCNRVDDDCDGTVDEADAADAVTWYADADHDGYGDADTTSVGCTAPAGYIADDSDCDDTDPSTYDCAFTDFDGTYGTTWHLLASPSESLYSLQSYHTSDMQYIYNMYDSTGQKYDPDTDTWSTLSASAPYSAPWTQMAPYDGYLWMIRNSSIYKYNPLTDGWSTLTSYTGSDAYNMTESDEYGVIYGHTSGGVMVSYDTSSGAITYSTTGKGGQSETRLGYDPDGRAIFFGAYSNANLYRWDIASKAVTTVTSIPAAQLNDIFCSDRSGHIYAAGNTSGTTMYQYDIVSDTWTRMPDLPTDHGNNGSCLVSADGWLYVGTGSNMKWYRIELY